MKLVLKRLEWGIFANEFGLNSSYLLIIGGILGTNKFFPRWQISFYSLTLGILVFLLEYPRMYRTDLSAVERKYQRIFEPFVSALGSYGKSYFIRFYLYFCLSLPCFFLLPTFFGGACIFTGSFIYLKAAISGFEWQPFPRKQIISPITVSKASSDYSQLDKLKETVC